MAGKGHRDAGGEVLSWPGICSRPAPHTLQGVPKLNGSLCLPPEEVPPPGPFTQGLKTHLRA